MSISKLTLKTKDDEPGSRFEVFTGRGCHREWSDALGYLTDILTRIVNGHPNSQIDDLVPWAHTAKLGIQSIGLRTAQTREKQ